MRFENLLTNQDIERAAKLTVTPQIMTGAAMSQLNAIEAFWTDIIHPYIHQHETLPLRQLAMASLGDRLIGHARIVPKLNALVFQKCPAPIRSDQIPGRLVQARCRILPTFGGEVANSRGGAMAKRSIHLVMAVLSCVAVGAEGCDPHSASLKILNDQGLTLLRPARDYVKVGGIVIKPAKGRADYEDPSDPVAEVPGTTTAFRAVILREVRRKSASIDTALGALTTIVPLPIDIEYGTAQEVTLSQIDATGIRLTTSALRNLIEKPDTRKELFDEIQKGRRVFIVQEVYTAKELEITSQAGKELRATYRGEQLRECPQTEPTAPARLAKTEQPNPAEKKDASPLSAATIRVCRSSKTTLKLLAESAIPFAVRLKEVGVTRTVSGPPREVIGKFPPQAEPESRPSKIILRLVLKEGAAKFDRQPVIDEMIRRSK